VPVASPPTVNALGLTGPDETVKGFVVPVLVTENMPTHGGADVEEVMVITAVPLFAEKQLDLIPV